MFASYIIQGFLIRKKIMNNTYISKAFEQGDKKPQPKVPIKGEFKLQLFENGELKDEIPDDVNVRKAD